MSVPPDKTVFTLMEAATLLNCHRETLRRAIRAGELRAAKLGRGFRISRFDLEDFWTKSGGGELFGKSAEADPALEEALTSKAALKAAQKRKAAHSGSEQFSLLDSLGTMNKGNGD